MKYLISTALIFAIAACKHGGDADRANTPNTSVPSGNASIACQQQPIESASLPLCTNCTATVRMQMLEQNLLKLCNSKRASYSLFVTGTVTQAFVDCRAMDTNLRKFRFLEVSLNGATMTLSAMQNMTSNGMYCVPPYGEALKVAGRKLCTNDDKSLVYAAPPPANISLVICRNKEDKNSETFYRGISQLVPTDPNYRFEEVKSTVVVSPQ